MNALLYHKKEIIFILLPLIYGLLGFVSSPFIGILFGLFWLWTGLTFALLNIHKLKSFLLGNILWLSSFLLYLWQFLILDNESRNLTLSFISQMYVQPLIWYGTKLSQIISEPNVINTTMIVILSYVTMFVIFLAGFIIGMTRIPHAIYGKGN